MVSLEPDAVARLRTALTRAAFTVDAVVDLLGGDAHRALLRNETVPALRATSDGSTLSTLTRLFSLQTTVPARAAEDALPGLVPQLCSGGVLAQSAGEVRALVDIRPYGDEEHDWWVVADLTPGLDGGPRRVEVDHVLGISPASSTLAQLTIHNEVGTALDLGTGCGVQALHLATHAGQVVATDVNARALSMARLTAALNRVEVDVRTGSLFEPVHGEQFDLVVTSPPFVVSPASGERLVYRDSGLPGDEVVRRIVSGAPDHLREGGWCQVLANWAHQADQPWTERVEEWLGPTGCDAWVLQREVTDLPTYVEMWLADAGLHGEPDYRERYDAWLSWFEQQRIEAVGFGWLCLRKAGREHPTLRIEDWPYELEQPIGPHVAEWGRTVDRLAGLTGADLLEQRLVRTDVVQETVGEPGAEDPQRIVLRLRRGVLRARPADTLDAAVVGTCDGELTLGQILTAVVSLTGADLVLDDFLPTARELVAEGFLEPAAPQS